MADLRWALSAGLLLACSSSTSPISDAAFDVASDVLGDAAVDATDAGDGALGPAYLRTLGSRAELDELASGLPGVKWLGKVADRAAAAPVGDGCLLQNPARWMYHLPFLQTFPETQSLQYPGYIERVLRRDTRVWWGGDLGWRESLLHPIQGTAGTLVFTFYTEASTGNQLRIEDIREVTALIRSCVPFAADRIAFSPSSNEQLVTTRSLQSQLASEGIAVLLP